jgi:hypothetical protein
MLYNPYQLVVWARNGKLLYREHISAQVAKLSPKREQEFARRFPQAARLLAPYYFTYTGSVYLDFRLLGIPNRISEDAFNYLFGLRVPHPYSDDFHQWEEIGV